MCCCYCDRDGLSLSPQICPKCNAYLLSLRRDLLPPGTLLNHSKYRIDSSLGRGGFGVTYRGIHTDLSQPIAIKEFYPLGHAVRDRETSQLIIPSDKEETFQRSIKFFLREAQILNSICHPNVVRFRDYFLENNTAYIVMNLISGQTLSSFLKAQPNNCLPPAKVKEIISALIEPLETIHKASIYHLDIKPDNILITDDGQIVLIDFGASKQGVSSHNSQPYTLSYAPPEVISGKKIGAYSDIYEVGVTIYEMLTGLLPPNALDRKCKEENWQPTNLEQPWRNLVELALKMKAKERPQSILTWWQTAFDEKQIGKSFFSNQNNQLTATVRLPLRLEKEKNTSTLTSEKITNRFTSSTIIERSTSARKTSIPLKPKIMALIGLMKGWNLIILAFLTVSLARVLGLFLHPNPNYENLFAPNNSAELSKNQEQCVDILSGEKIGFDLGYDRY